MPQIKIVKNPYVANEVANSKSAPSTIKNSSLTKYRADLERLMTEGNSLLTSMAAQYNPEGFEKAAKLAGCDPTQIEESALSFSEYYQIWYSEAKAVIKQMLPHRLDDFVSHYEPPKNRKELSVRDYRIKDALQGLVVQNFYNETVVGPANSIVHFKQQLQILSAVKRRFQSSLFDIKQLLQADVFDSEIETAKELSKKGFIRAAGAICGVVLEKHLALVASNHGLAVKKKHPTISDWNDLLKDSDIVEIPQWRGIQRLTDIRNLCDHNKNREPSADDIEELIKSVDKLLKTLF